MSLTIQCIRTTRELLADPRRWVKGFWSAHRDAHGVVRPLESGNYAIRSNCWCLSQAITNAVLMNTGPSGNGVTQTTALDVSTFAELRSDVERELLETLGNANRWPVVYLFNDADETSHADVLGLLDRTLLRFGAA